MRRARAQHRKRRYLYKQAWEAFLVIFNGVVWAADASVGPHYSETLGDFRALKQEAVLAVARLLFRAMPQKPVRGKWTKLGPCCDWWSLALGMMNMLKRLWRDAYGRLAVRVVQPACGDDPEVAQ